MGGTGSGRHWLSKKTTVEDCFTLTVEEFTSRNLLHSRPWGELRWTRGGAEIGSVYYQLRNIGLKDGESVYILTLIPPLIHRDQTIRITQDISLVTTKLCSGGKQYWFLCPSCRQRVGRLHLPYGEDRFLCRTCHNLTYKSCQESHKFDWFFAELGVPPWVGKWLFKRDRSGKVRI